MPARPLVCCLKTNEPLTSFLFTLFLSLKFIIPEDHKIRSDNYDIRGGGDFSSPCLRLQYLFPRLLTSQDRREGCYGPLPLYLPLFPFPSALLPSP